MKNRKRNYSLMIEQGKYYTPYLAHEFRFLLKDQVREDKNDERGGQFDVSELFWRGGKIWKTVPADA